MILTKLISWVDARYPVTPFLKEHTTEYYAPNNFNFWYYFGALSLVMLVNQIVTGIWLTMSYNPSAEGAFASIEYIMRDVNFGWLIRYMHAIGASFFFIVIYLHMFRAMLYGSYRKPRELVWLLGMFIFLCLLAEAFFGYLLPWGNMSFWGAQVITSLFSAIPYVGNYLVEFIRGDYNISGVTLNRFFAMHVVLVPLILLGIVGLHILALHNVGSNNPDGIEIKKHKDAQGRPLDGVPFHPYYTVKDTFGLAVFLIFFVAVIFFIPDFFGLFLEAPNFTPANSMQTPEHITPVWYMTPYYAILRAIPNKVMGVAAMGGSIFVLFLLPWLDRSPVKSIRYKGNKYKIALGLFVVSFIGLGYLGMQEPNATRNAFARIFTLIYFGFFILMPIYTTFDKTKPEPREGYTLIVARLLILLFLTTQAVYAAEEIDPTQVVPMLSAPVDVTDFASIQRGAQLYMNLCSGCHSLKYVRYDALAQGIQITDESGKVLEKLVKDNLIFVGDSMSDYILTAMPPKDAADWFGVVPPDLTLEARYRGADWIYNYLKTFYVDHSRPWGVNNVVYPSVAMPNVLLDYQGEQVLTKDGLKIVRPGSMTPEQFNRAVADLVNFLCYVSEPVQTLRREIGAWVLVFVGIFLVFSYLLKREYWKDIH